MDNKKIRMADIAARLGVSVVSVSKALSGKDGVSEETRARIVELAQEMGYTPLRTREHHPVQASSGNIGVLVADQFFADNTFYSNLYRRIVKRCGECGYSALLELVTPEAESRRSMPVMVQRRKVDGLIFLGEIDRAYLHSVSACGLPYVLLVNGDTASASEIASPATTSPAVTASPGTFWTPAGTGSASWAARCPPAPSWTGTWATAKPSAGRRSPCGRTG